MRLPAPLGLLLLFVAVPALAQPPQPGWGTDQRTGWRVWTPLTLPDGSAVPSGSCQNGMAPGQSVLQWSKNGRFEETNDGEFHDGRFTGRGVYTFANGDRYDGEFRDDKFSGWGVYTFATGDRYDGEFRDGKRNGRGVYIIANGDRYDGEFRDDRFNGRGVYTFATGDRYDGEFRDGRRNGRGVYSNTNGERYDGEFRDDKLITKYSAPRNNVSEITLKKEAGVLVVPVRINNALTLNFAVDSGADDVSVPSDVVMTLTTPLIFSVPHLVPIRADSLPGVRVFWDEWTAWTWKRRTCAMVDD